MNPMSRLAGCALLLALMTACVGPHPVFNGYTLDGWQQEGEIQWAVSEQVIVASGAGDGFLASDAQFGDFYLRVEFWPDALSTRVFLSAVKTARVSIPTPAMSLISGMSTRIRKRELALSYLYICRLWRKLQQWGNGMSMR